VHLRGIALLAVSLGCLNGANLFVNSGFETPGILDTSATLPNGSTDLTGWTVTGGCGLNCVAILVDAYTEDVGGRLLEFRARTGQ